MRSLSTLVCELLLRRARGDDGVIARAGAQQVAAVAGLIGLPAAAGDERILYVDRVLGRACIRLRAEHQHVMVRHEPVDAFSDERHGAVASGGRDPGIELVDDLDVVDVAGAKIELDRGGDEAGGRAVQARRRWRVGEAAARRGGPKRIGAAASRFEDRLAVGGLVAGPAAAGDEGILEEIAELRAGIAVIARAYREKPAALGLDDGADAVHAVAAFLRFRQR